MKLSHFFAGLGIGAAATYYLLSKKEEQFLSPKKILTLMKNDATKDGEFADSWLCEFVEEKEFNGLSIPFYQGGIIQIKDGQKINTNYLIHAKTGEILEVSIA